MKIIDNLLCMLCVFGIIFSIWASSLLLFQDWVLSGHIIEEKYLIGIGLTSFTVAITLALIAVAVEQILSGKEKS